MAARKSSKKALKSLPKLFILDTNVLLHDPSALFSFEEHDVLLTMPLLEELDKFKSGTSELNRNARRAIRSIESVFDDENGDIDSGYSLSNVSDKRATGKAFFQKTEKATAQGLNLSINDNRFIAAAMAAKELTSYGAIVLVSKDVNLRIKCKALGLVASDYKHDHAIEDSDLLRTGWMRLPDGYLQTQGDSVKAYKSGPHCFYQLPISKEFNPELNEAVIFEDGSEFSVVEKDVVGTQGSVTIRSLTNHYSEKNNVWGITARNFEQNFALNLLLDPELDIVTLLGVAGTGKTLLALAAALEQVIESKRYDEIIFTRATVPMGEEIGFLPGTEEEKMAPWLGALEDNLEVLLKDGGENAWQKSTTKELVRSKIKIRSTSFMRGRTFNNKFVILDEAQNFTPAQMKALITRCGPGTKLVAMGNLSQIDTAYLTEYSSGLTSAVEGFKGWPHFGNIILAQGERSRLASYANENL